MPYFCRYLGKLNCVNTDSVNIICSTNCVHCTVTNPTQGLSTSLPGDAEDVSTSVREPYTSEKLSRLRSAYKLLSSPAAVVKFNFNSPQVCNGFDTLCSLTVDFTTLPCVPKKTVVPNFGDNFVKS